MTGAALLPALFAGLAAAMLAGAVVAWCGWRAPLLGAVAGMHIALALGAVLIWPERADWHLAPAYAGLLAAPFAGAVVAGFALHIRLAQGAAIAAVLGHAVVVAAMAWRYELPAVNTALVAVYVAPGLAGAWVVWRSAASGEYGKRAMAIAAASALPLLPLAFSFFGVVGIAPSLLFLAGMRSRRT